jgi:hypothetical protein
MTLDPISAIQTSLGINRKATVLAIGGFVVMAAAIGLFQMADDDRLTFWQLLAGLAALIVLMMVLTHLPLMARRAIGWVLAGCFGFIAVTATLQTVTNNSIPRLASATCILSFHLASSCSVSPAGAAVAGEPSADLEPGSPFGNGMVVRAITFTQGTEAAPNERVFIQFAGYDRKFVIDLAGTLVAAGWRVEGADRGGERIAGADGLNEVRYFHTGDAERAVALAARAGEWAGGRVFAVVDLSASKYGQAERGLLEIWISE